MARAREAAQRIFAVEFNGSQHEDRGMEENAPNYVITPLGSRVNRLYFTGVMMNKDNTGTEDSPMYRAEIRDPTGIFYLYAGQFQPQAVNALKQLEPPILVGVVGKVRTFVKEDGTFYTSVKPESVFPVDIPQRDRWILSAVKFTREKMDALKKAMEMEEPDLDELLDQGIVKRAAEAAVEGVGLYGNVALDPYRDAMKNALRMVVEGGGESIGDLPEIYGVAEGPKDSDEEEREVTQGVDKEDKEKVVSIIKELSDEKGAFYRDILSKCEKEGIDKIMLEETVQELLDEGTIYEPTIGIIKPI